MVIGGAPNPAAEADGCGAVVVVAPATVALLECLARVDDHHHCLTCGGRPGDIVCCVPGVFLVLSQLCRLGVVGALADHHRSPPRATLLTVVNGDVAQIAPSAGGAHRWRGAADTTHRWRGAAAPTLPTRPGSGGDAAKKVPVAEERALLLRRHAAAVADGDEMAATAAQRRLDYLDRLTRPAPTTFASRARRALVPEPRPTVAPVPPPPPPPARTGSESDTSVVFEEEEEGRDDTIVFTEEPNSGDAASDADGDAATTLADTALLASSVPTTGCHALPSPAALPSSPTVALPPRGDGPPPEPPLLVVREGDAGMVLLLQGDSIVGQLADATRCLAGGGLRAAPHHVLACLPPPRSNREIGAASDDADRASAFDPSFLLCFPGGWLLECPPDSAFEKFRPPEHPCDPRAQRLVSSDPRLLAMRRTQTASGGPPGEEAPAVAVFARNRAVAVSRGSEVFLRRLATPRAVADAAWPGVLCALFHDCTSAATDAAGIECLAPAAEDTTSLIALASPVSAVAFDKHGSLMTLEATSWRLRCHGPAGWRVGGGRVPSALPPTPSWECRDLPATGAQPGLAVCPVTNDALVGLRNASVAIVTRGVLARVVRLSELSYSRADIPSELSLHAAPVAGIESDGRGRWIFTLQGSLFLTV